MFRIHDLAIQAVKATSDAPPKACSSVAGQGQDDGAGGDAWNPTIMTHDCKCHGTTTLFAALDDVVIGRNMHRHRHQEFIRFLNAIETQAPTGKAIHIILDNCAVRFFAKLSKRRLEHGVFCSIAELQAAINRYITESNENP